MIIYDIDDNFRDFQCGLRLYEPTVCVCVCVRVQSDAAQVSLLVSNQCSCCFTRPVPTLCMCCASLGGLVLKYGMLRQVDSALLL